MNDEAKIYKLELENSAYKKKNIELSAKVYKLEFENRTYRRKSFEQSTKIIALQKKVDKFEAEFDEIVAKKTKSLEDRFDRLEKRFNKIIESKDIKIKELTDRIAFLEAEIKTLKKQHKEEIKAKDLEIRRLKAKLNINSANSGIPTSQTNMNQKKRIPNTREKTEKSPGGQLGHKKRDLKKFKKNEINEIVDVKLTSICTCGCNLSTTKVITKDVIDIFISTIKTRYNYHNCTCKKCGKEYKANIPKSQHSNVSYGETINSLAVLLINDTNVPYNKIKKLLYGITNNEINISEGYLVKLQKKSAKLLSGFKNDLKSKIIDAKVLHWDDTVIKINKKKSCFRFYGTKNLAYYTAHLKKDADGMKLDNIFDNLTRKTTLVHDHLLSNYNSKYSFKNAECCQHLIRDLKKCNEFTEHKWNTKLLELIMRAKKETDFTIQYYNDYILEFDTIIAEGYEEYKNETKYNDKNELTLLNRLAKFKHNYSVFVTNKDIPFTNNLAERSLRMCKSKMKISGQFNNIDTANAYATNRTYIETCYRNSVNSFEALKLLFKGTPCRVADFVK